MSWLGATTTGGDESSTRAIADRLRRTLPDWLKPRLDAEDLAVTGARQLVGGHANQTWRIDYAGFSGGRAIGSSFIIRWAPEGGLLAPSDIPEQFALLDALAKTDVPIAAPLWLGLDDAVVGAPFLTMKVAPGVTPHRVLELDDPYRDAKRRAHAEMLARIHAVDWRALGLESLLPLPSPDRCALDAIAMVHGWAAERGLADEPWFAHALAWLTERAPTDAQVGLLHGDPNLTNYRFEGTEIVAVLDWDAAKLSDPLWDIGAVSGAMYLYFADQPASVQQRERDAYLEPYRQASGRDLADLSFWEPLFVLRASVLLYHPSMDNRMSAILRAKIGGITGFAQ